MAEISKAKGKQAEKNAEKLMCRHGLKTIARNYRARSGEIDLVMKDGDTLVFAEVRYRQNDAWGNSIETVDRHKQRKIIAAAESYLLRQKHSGPIRFDVIGFDGALGEKPKWIKNAFEAN